MCANSTFYPAGVHTVNYSVTYSRTITSQYTDKSFSFCHFLCLCLVRSVRLNPADLLNHPGAPRQDPVTGDSLHFSCPHTICPRAILARFIVTLHHLLLTWCDIKDKMKQHFFLFCMNTVAYTFKPTIIPEAHCLFSKVNTRVMQLSLKLVYERLFCNFCDILNILTVWEAAKC